MGEHHGSEGRGFEATQITYFFFFRIRKINIPPYEEQSKRSCNDEQIF